ncbi:hypothetical protein [Azospirillum sp. B4]|uniref:hypothetical protein n=1 Tax=Azospirillum sp. B4 TaxID=95605 RepID=UPI00034853C8|nr:hypothetical protein [Azospirillum sp. B4]
MIPWFRRHPLAVLLPLTALLFVASLSLGASGVSLAGVLADWRAHGEAGDAESATGDAATSITSIASTIVRINEIASTIASAVEEQGAATREIASNVQQAAVGTTEIASNISGVTEAATHTGGAATQMLGTAERLSTDAGALRTQVNSFLSVLRAA